MLGPATASAGPVDAQWQFLSKLYVETIMSLNIPKAVVASVKDCVGAVDASSVEVFAPVTKQLFSRRK